MEETLVLEKLHLLLGQLTLTLVVEAEAHMLLATLVVTLLEQTMATLVVAGLAVDQLLTLLLENLTKVAVVVEVALALEMECLGVQEL